MIRIYSGIEVERYLARSTEPCNGDSSGLSETVSQLIGQVRDDVDHAHLRQGQ